jgi:hypothetical protein
MPDETTVLIDISGVKKMADPIDLSPNVANAMLTGLVGDVNANTRDGRNLGTAAIGSLTAGIAKAHNELDSIEAAANTRVIESPK